MTKSLMVTHYHHSNSEERDQPFWQDVFSDPHDLYYQRALEAAFPEEEPSKIRAVVQRIKQLRSEYPRVMEFVDQGLYGIATGLQYSAYAAGAVGGFVAGEFVNPIVGGYYGAPLGLSMVKSAESLLGEAFQYGYAKASNWYSGEVNSWRQMDRRLVFQELTTEVLPFLALMGLKGVKASPLQPGIHLKQGLLPTDFSKLSRQYIIDMNTRAGIHLGETQTNMLAIALRSKRFDKLDPVKQIEHVKQYRTSKDTMIGQWEHHTGQTWPRYPTLNRATGEIEMTKAQIHHIIPQEVGGPHVWWNAHSFRSRGCTSRWCPRFWFSIKSNIEGIQIMSEKYEYFRKYMRTEYKTNEPVEIGKNNLFYPVSVIDIENAEAKMGASFPSQLKQFYLKIGFGYLTTPHNAGKEYDFYSSNLILPPNSAACFFKGQLCDDWEQYYMAETAYELLQPGDLPFFEISDSSSFMIMKINSDNPNAVWFMGHEKIEDSFEKFIWRLYYEDPSYYSKNW